MLRDQTAFRCTVIVAQGFFNRRGLAGALLLVAAAFSAISASRLRVDEGQLVEDVRYLASVRLEGRGTGRAGLDLAAEYIADQFRRAGVLPAGPNGYFQRFSVTTDAALGESNSLVVQGDTGSALQLSRDYTPLTFSASGVASGPMVFAGYGITAKEYGYDDYAGIDARGKIVVILRHEPQEFDGESVFEGRIYTEHSQMLRKALNARAHGAAAVLYVNDVASHSGADVLEALNTFPGPANTGILFAHVKAEAVERWFQVAGRSFGDTQRVINEEGRPQSFSFPISLQASVSLDVRSKQVTVANVAALLPGVTSEYVIAGAHYDHLGFGEQYSLAPDQTGVAHPGADDNASGTAGVLAVARYFAAQPKTRRGILFLAFAGEELGLLGSTHYTDQPLIPLQNAVAMLNMDMIGRLREARMTVGGSFSGEGLRELVERAGRRHGLELDTDDRTVYGSSDHTTFLARQIPVLFFFTGLHADYHRPSDTPDKIHGREIASVVRLVADVAGEIATRPERIHFRARLPKPLNSGGRNLQEPDKPGR